ncbi:hypothetical protein THRCLA_20533 [Thraustotheca clavata]|uniref:Phosphatidate phosphatase APP1 catalytic domain-containing protein n=1 Tax=Thraustotheca clavata TaxID=74557 RepID=A0A1W0A665_9STRA|nr:hypothetical protein THRCLA_20533 [Thraustotheca clavata]
MIDRIYLPSTINNMINMENVKEQEYKTFTVLNRAEKNDLNYIISQIPLALLLYKVKDQNRTLLLQLLCENRLSDLTIQSRAIVLDALMLMRISAHERCERYVKNIITRTTGDDLSLLKSTTDSKGNVYSMHKLIYHDIKDVAIRNAILSHIQRVATVQRTHMQLKTTYTTAKLKQQAWRKVLSDVDDTLYSSGGRYPAGMDTRYPRHTIYPGVFAFYRQLDLGNCGLVNWEEGRIGNLVFLSARPHVYKDVSEKKSYEKFKTLHDKNGLHTLPSLLAGSMASGMDFMMRGDLEPMARKKFENFCEYYSIYPEYKHVFIGDNGQGDVRAAQLIAEKYGPSVLEAAYFHKVQPIENTFGFKDLATYRKLNIFFFDTYVGAAVQAYRMKQISLEGLKQICMEAVFAFDKIKFPTPSTREAQRANLNRDLELANEFLGPKALKLVEKPQLYPDSTILITPFGKGQVLHYNAITGIYTINLTQWWLKTKNTARLYLPDSSLALTKRSPDDFSAKATPLATEMNPLNYVKTNFVTAIDPLLLLQGVFPPDTPVQTPFGKGRIVRYREDKVYEVHLLKHACTKANQIHAYCHQHLVTKIEEIEPPPPAQGFVRTSLEFFAKAFLLPFGSGKPTKETPKAASLYSKGSTVMTPFGKATIEDNDNHPIYKCQLTKSALRDTRVFIQESSLSAVIEVPRASGIFSLLTFTKDKSVEKPVYQKNTIVTTWFGTGAVRRYRNRDQTYEILFGTTIGYFHANEVKEKPREVKSSGGGFFGRISTFVKGNPATTEAEQAAMVLSPPMNQFKVDSRVETPFGPGRVNALHDNDNGVHVVNLSEPNLEGVKAFVQQTSLVEIEEVTRKYSLIDTLTSFRRYYERDPPPSEAQQAAHSDHDARGDAFQHARAIDAVHIDDKGQAFVQGKQDLRFPVHGRIGFPVSTVFGPGVLHYVSSANGVHIIMWRDGTIGYIQGKDVYGEIKAVVGDWVNTPFGKGRVRSYRRNDHVYVVASEKALKQLCYVQESCIERIVLESVEIVPSSCGIM